MVALAIALSTEWLCAQTSSSSGLRDVSAQPELVLQAYEVLAAKGDRVAQLKLGEMYEMGKGVPNDLRQAAYWYERAAEQGLADAQYAIAQMYDVGLGVTPDSQKAAIWYERAADQGFVDAQDAIASIYAAGQGVSKNPDMANAWRDKATSGQKLASGVFRERDGSLTERYRLADTQRKHEEISLHLSAGKGVKARDLIVRVFLGAKTEVEKAAALNNMLTVCMAITDDQCFIDYWDAHYQLLARVPKLMPQSTTEEKEAVDSVYDSFFANYAYRLHILPHEQSILKHLERARAGVDSGVRYASASLRAVAEAKLAIIVGQRDLARKLLRRGRALLLSRNLNRLFEQLTLANLLETSTIYLSDTQDINRFFKAFGLAAKDANTNLDTYFNPYVALRLYSTIYEAGALSSVQRLGIAELLHSFYQNLELPTDSKLAQAKETFYATLALKEYWGDRSNLTFEPGVELKKLGTLRSIGGFSVQLLIEMMTAQKTTKNLADLEQWLNSMNELKQEAGPSIQRQYEPVYHFVSAIRFRAIGDARREIESLNQYAVATLEMYRKSGLGLFDNPPAVNHTSTVMYRYIISRFLDLSPESEQFKQMAYHLIVALNAAENADTQASYAMLSSADSDLQRDQIQYFIRVRQAYSNAVSDAYYKAARNMAEVRDKETFDGGVPSGTFVALLDSFQVAESQLASLWQRPNPFGNLDFKKLKPDKAGREVRLFAQAESFGLSLAINKQGVKASLVDFWGDVAFREARSVLTSKSLDEIPKDLIKKSSLIFSEKLSTGGFQLETDITLLSGASILGVPYTLLSNPTSGRWLIQDVNISSYVSIYHYDIAQKADDGGRPIKFVAFANPVLRSNQEQIATAELAKLIRGKRGGVADLAELPETEMEARKLGQGFQGNKDFYFGLDANIENLLSINWDNVGVLSLNTHGVLAGEIDGALSSSLILSPTEKSSGVIPADWLFAMPGAPQFVLLSTCNSGTTALPLDRSEIDSLSSAFLLKGSQAVISSYWQVDSLGTSELMGRFSESLSSGKTFNTAFVESIRDLIKVERWSHPSIWAAFTIVGGAAQKPTLQAIDQSLSFPGVSMSFQGPKIDDNEATVVVFNESKQRTEVNELTVRPRSSGLSKRLSMRSLESNVASVFYSTNSVFGRLRAVLDETGDWRFFRHFEDRESLLCSVEGLDPEWAMINLFTNRSHIFSLFTRDSKEGRQYLISSQSIDGCRSKFVGPIEYKGVGHLQAIATLFPLQDGSRVIYAEGIFRDDANRFYAGPISEIGVKRSCQFYIHNNFNVLKEDLSLERTSRFANIWIKGTEKAATQVGVSAIWYAPCIDQRLPKVLSEDWFLIESPEEKHQALTAASRPMQHIEDLIASNFGFLMNYWWSDNGEMVYVYGSPGRSTDFYQDLLKTRRDMNPYNPWSRAMNGIYAYNRKAGSWRKLSSVNKCEFPLPLGYTEDAFLLCNRLALRGAKASVNLIPVQ